MPLMLSHQQFIEKMMEGDPKCEYIIGTKVEKFDSDEGDLHLTGAKGEVKGSLFHPDFLLPCYLIQFEGTSHLVFILGSKIKKIE